MHSVFGPLRGEEEAVAQLDDEGTDAPVPFARWQEVEETMGVAGGAVHNAAGSTCGRRC